MTIRPGEDWGEVVAAPPDLVVVRSDADLAAHVAAPGGQPVRLLAGDLLTSVGGASPGPEVRQLPIDVLRVESDTGSFTAVAHVVARRSWWRGPILAVMNVDHLGRWDVAPRAHPNDGRADVVEVATAMGARARWHAWRRLPSGSHLPHPALHVRRVADERWSFQRPRRLWVDGVGRGTTRGLRVVVEPDAAVVHC